MTSSAASQFRWANLVTYVAVSSATVGVVLTSDPSTRSYGGAAIAIAAALDLFDGRFARLFTRTEDDKRFGVEIDSLADVISFGLAPAVCILRVVPPTSSVGGAILLLAGLFYLLCIATRLAHYNIFQADTGGFVGVPSSVSAVACAILLFWLPGQALATIVLIAAGAMSVGGVRIPRPTPVALYAVLAIFLSVAGAHIYLLFAR